MTNRKATFAMSFLLSGGMLLGSCASHGLWSRQLPQECIRYEQSDPLPRNDSYECYVMGKKGKAPSRLVLCRNKKPTAQYLCYPWGRYRLSVSRNGVEFPWRKYKIMEYREETGRWWYAGFCIFGQKAVSFS